MAFSTDEVSVHGTVTVWARIDRGAVDRLLRLLQPGPGGFLDRKLREQFNVAAKVAEAAARHPERICPLIEAGSQDSPDERHALAALAGC